MAQQQKTEGMLRKY